MPTKTRRELQWFRRFNKRENRAETKRKKEQLRIRKIKKKENRRKKQAWWHLKSRVIGAYTSRSTLQLVSAIRKKKAAAQSPLSSRWPRCHSAMRPFLSKKCAAVMWTHMSTHIKKEGKINRDVSQPVRQQTWAENAPKLQESTEAE